MTASHSSSVADDEHAVAHQAGVVHDHVEPAERVDGGVDEPSGAVPVGHVVAVDDRLAAHRLDVGDDLGRRPRGRVARTVELGAEVVDDDAAPWRASSSAWLRPMPRPAPVTMTTRPSHIPGMGADGNRPAWLASVGSAAWTWA